MRRRARGEPRNTQPLDGGRVRGDLHVQTVNSRHSRLKDFLRPRRGIATRYLDNYLSWFHLVGLAPGANDRACLAAAVTR